MSAPAVSIVLITYNDAGRVMRAIDSALGQTLHDLEVIVVDDCSTDATRSLVAARMAGDDRLRLVSLPENSGGCSAPRNRGIDEARGAWVMFCDSDDELEAHAAKNLLLAVESADADLGCGVVERVDVRTSKSVRWRAELHESGVLAGIGERPGLIADTVSVNKIYRRQWLLDQGNRFPEGVLYEDQLFTMRAYAEARRIAVTDVSVYRWYVERLAEELSITQRRRELRNVRDRIAVNRMIDEYLETTDRRDLIPVKQAKFLRHEMYLYLGVVLDADDETADAIIAELADYVETSDVSLCATLRPGLRVAIYHALLRDREGVRAAMKSVRWSAVLPMPVLLRDHRDLWHCEHLDANVEVGGLPAEWWLDITALHPSIAPLADQRHCHEVTRFASHGSEISVEGTTVDAYGVLTRARDVVLVLAVGTATTVELPLTAEVREGVLHWTGSGRLRRGHGSAVEPHQRGSVALAVTIDGVRTIIAVRSAHRVEAALATPAVRFASGDQGTIGWRADLEHSTTARVVGRIRRVFGVRIAAFAALLPARRSIVFMADGGTTCNGSARALSEWLSVEHPEIPQVWVYQRDAAQVPGYARGVRGGGVRHRWAAARVRWWVSDGQVLRAAGTGVSGGAMRGARDRRHLVLLDGSIEHVGSDVVDWPMLSAAKRRVLQVAGADVVAAPGGELGHRIVRALGIAAPTVDGSPLIEKAAAASDARIRLGLDPDRPVVMWAAVRESTSLIESVAQRIDGRIQLLVHAPGVRIPAALRAWVRDTSGDGTLVDMLAACDVVVTDVSPLALMAAALGRPVVIATTDVGDLVSRGPGLYVDWPRQAPGPVVSTPDDILAAIDDAVRARPGVPEPFADAHRVFADLVARGVDGSCDRAWRALVGDRR